MSQRPPIPSRIKRKVRQRCGFGCVICGLPIYDYDHLPGYANVKRHRAEEITLLCQVHHGMKTKGLLADAQVEAANLAPFNLRSDTTSPLRLFFDGAVPEIVLAEQLFTCSDRRRPTVMAPFVINRQIPFAFTLDANGLLLNLDARNSKNERVLLIRESELVLSRTAWDASIVGSTLSIWNEPRDISLELEFIPPKRIVIRRYRISIDGKVVVIDPEKIQLKGDSIPTINVSGNGTISANVGLLVGEAPKGLSVGIKIG